jgi:hypothetical protein
MSIRQMVQRMDLTASDGRARLAAGSPVRKNGISRLNCDTAIGAGGLPEGREPARRGSQFSFPACLVGQTVN